jgi:indole-3-glycerol phosphate synthase
LIREDFLPKEIAQRYTQNGVSVISVLTDARFFLGSLEYLRQVREVTDLPLLRKDFIIDPYQLYESQAAGADAVLLIVNILTEEELRQMLNLTKELGLTALVEIHTLAELEIAKRVDAKVIGINNRNLKTFDTNIEQTLKLKDFLPKDKILVSESGISTRIDVEQLASAGVDGILVGEALMKSDNLGRKVQTLLGKDVATNG